MFFKFIGLTLTTLSIYGVHHFVKEYNLCQQELDSGVGSSDETFEENYCMVSMVTYVILIIIVVLLNLLLLALISIFFTS
ncbi:MAG TPA: hypothetical protein PLO25_00425 [Candidatus Saccharibacteria bacterium]|nr:hypothetical protein [Candidatus Saccharibacteria bacterium]